MEGFRIDEVSYENHISKCRICFKSFAPDEQWIDINKSIERKFLQVTQTSLKMTNQYSKKICVVCNFQLTTFCHAKVNMIKAQKALIKFLNSSQKSKNSENVKNPPTNDTIIIKFQNVESPRNIEVNQVLDVDEEVKEEEIIEEHLIDDEHFHEVSYQIVQNSSNSTLKCDICSIIFDNTSDFDVHMTTHVPPSLQIQETFQKSEELKNISNYQQHIQKSPNFSKWTCHECNKSFSSGSSLTNHIAIYHSTSSIELPCPVVNCEKKCRTKKQLTQHLKTHNEDKQICPECGLVVGNKHNLTKHIKRLHLKIYNFYCDLCDYKGFFKFNIDQHMKKHLDKSERERFYCDECQFESISKMSLRTHKRMEHMGQKKSYLCHCGKKFTQSSSYYTHVKVVHQKIKNHACPYTECTKTFSEKSQLKNHIKSQHLKKRDIPCSQCGKQFSTQKHLTAHLKYHKPASFICQYENCSNAFFTLTQLNSHYKVHNNQRDYACQLCEKKYFHRSHLKKHLLTHSNNNVLR
ncbi:gastrula zinc finger protein XlCGF26.1-like [Chironomus tepperi]|uniref:gastrula zinc finger protein XlCGF26.1-like n=1 Tax=Chironomus tepperi TaxID=113505 RepID=UPI00391EE591